MGLFGRDDQTTTALKPATGQQKHSEGPSRSQHPDDQTVIANKISIDGTLSGSGQITVDGRVSGSIEGSDSVIVAARGRVEATVHARTVSVSGRVIGNITADEKIELEPSAQVDGDITAPRILIKDGAMFKGQVNMRAPEPRAGLKTSSARKETATSNHRE